MRYPWLLNIFLDIVLNKLKKQLSVKKTTSLLCTFFLVLTLYGQHQTIVQGVVRDSLDYRPIGNAVVSLLGEKKGMLTNQAGEFSFYFSNENIDRDTLIVYSSGHKLKKIALKTTQKYYTVLVQPTSQEHNRRSWNKSTNKTVRMMSKVIDSVATIVVDDWLPMGNPEHNYFDFGRLQTIPSYNSIEGFRIRLGVASTARLHPHLFIKGYAAYGFRDNKMKCRAQLTYSFNDKKYHGEEYPKHNLNFIFENDIYAFGERHSRGENDALLKAYRLSKHAILYRRFTEINFEQETSFGLGYHLWTRVSKIFPADGLSFETQYIDGKHVHESGLKTSEIGLQLRYALDEHFENKRRSCVCTTPENTVLFLSHRVGMNGLLGGEITYHITETSLQKRFLLGRYGRIDGVAEYRKIWSRVPFPLLAYPNHRNQYIIENNAFYLTRALEFPADELLSLRFTWVGEGMMFRNVPFMRRLECGELVSVRAVKGTLSKKNIPTAQNRLFLLPETSMRMQETPYMEVAVGLTHILGFLRLEYVHRLTYRNNPDAILGGFRVDIAM